MKEELLEQVVDNLGEFDREDIQLMLGFRDDLYLLHT